MGNSGSSDSLQRRHATLEDLLADDVTRAVMQADHVAAREVRSLCKAVGALLEQRAGYA